MKGAHGFVTPTQTLTLALTLTLTLTQTQTLTLTLTLFTMAQGYSGSWLDSFHPQPQTGVRDAGGHVMNEWNMQAGGLMTFPTCMQQQVRLRGSIRV